MRAKRALQLVEPIEPEPVVVDLAFPDLVKVSRFPWKWKTGSIDEFRCVDIFHYTEAGMRGRFMEEVYRVLKPEGKATITVVYYSTMLACADYLLEWPPVNELSFMYFNKAWREMNQTPHKLKCDFDFTYGYILPPEVSARNQEMQSLMVKTQLNSVTRLQVVLTKRPM